MVYGIIDRHSMRAYTYLSGIFRAIGGRQKEYNWLITDAQIAAQSEELNLLSDGLPHFLSGGGLTELVEKDDGQWLFGVLSGFEKTIPPETILRFPLPYADGNPHFWVNPISLQHPLASVEIVPWDGTQVLLLSRRKELADSFRNAFPRCEDLKAHNDALWKR